MDERALRDVRDLGSEDLRRRCVHERLPPVSRALQQQRAQLAPRRDAVDVVAVVFDEIERLVEIATTPPWSGVLPATLTLPAAVAAGTIAAGQVVGDPWKDQMVCQQPTGPIEAV